LNGDAIAGSQFTALLENGNAGLSYADGPGLEAGHKAGEGPLQFTIHRYVRGITLAFVNRYLPLLPNTHSHFYSFVPSLLLFLLLSSAITHFYIRLFFFPYFPSPSTA
jgi:hypothetical protein